MFVILIKVIYKYLLMVMLANIATLLVQLSQLHSNCCKFYLQGKSVTSNVDKNGNVEGG